MSETADFLTRLWGEQPPGYIELWNRARKHSRYTRDPAGPVAGSVDGRPDTYTGVTLSVASFPHDRRAPINARIALAGLWLDLDVNGGPDKKRGAAPDKTAALSLSRALHAPTLVVDSGYGVHAWYLLQKPWQFTCQADQDQAALAAAQWYQLHRSRAQAQGWTVDHTHDLARLLRIPGTVNAKGGDTRPVTLLQSDGPRYPLEQLLAAAAAAGPIDVPGTHTRRAQVRARADAAPPTLKVEALAFNSPEFAASLQHEGHPAWSQSEWDLSLASQAAAAGWTEQEIADLVVWDRTRHGKGEKAQRAKYLQRTVAIATARADRDQAGDQLDLLARTAA
jgi:hypothetical protein